MPRVHVTFLAAHVVPPEYFGRRTDYIDAVGAWCADAATIGADGVDVNCEEGRFTEEEARWILSAGRRAGLGCRDPRLRPVPHRRRPGRRPRWAAPPPTC